MRFSNHIKRLDDDEIEFLSSTALEQRTKQIEEAKVVREELEAFREACKVAHAPTAPTSASSITSSISVSNELTSSTAATASRQSLVKDDVQRSILGSGLLIVKKRKLSASATRGGGEGVVGGGAESSSTPSNTEKNSPPGKSPVAKGLASLVSGYGSSDEDSD